MPGRTPRWAATTRPGPSQPGEQVEEVHAVLDEDAAALVAIPEPVLGRQALVGGVVLEVAVQHLARAPGTRSAGDRVEERVVALHEVGDEQGRSRARAAAIISSAWADGQRQGLLADDVLAGLQGGHRLRVVEERRRGDVDEVEVVAPRRSSTSSTFSIPNRAAAASDGGPVGAGHADELDAGHLGELLEREQAEAAAADHAQSNEDRLPWAAKPPETA